MIGVRLLEKWKTKQWGVQPSSYKTKNNFTNVKLGLKKPKKTFVVKQRRNNKRRSSARNLQLAGASRNYAFHTSQVPAEACYGWDKSHCKRNTGIKSDVKTVVSLWPWPLRRKQENVFQQVQWPPNLSRKGRFLQTNTRAKQHPDEG